MEYFNRLSDELENVANRMEEGLGVILNGGDSNGAQESSQQRSSHDPTIDLDEIDFDNLTEEELEQLVSEHMAGSSPLDGIAEGVVGDIMGSSIGPQTPMDHLKAFQSAITWSETFIICLVSFQIAMFLLSVWASRPGRGLTPRVTMLLSIGVIVRSAEYLNGYGARNWRTFATQNYFDMRGVFVGIMLCGPLIFDCMLMLAMFVREAAGLLVLVKREELKGKKKKEGETGRAKKAKSVKKND